VFTLPLQKFFKIIENKFGSRRGGSYIHGMEIKVMNKNKIVRVEFPCGKVLKAIKNEKGAISYEVYNSQGEVISHINQYEFIKNYYHSAISQGAKFN
jgi:hypothetical protein